MSYIILRSNQTNHSRVNLEPHQDHILWHAFVPQKFHQKIKPTIVHFIQTKTIGVTTSIMITGLLSWFVQHFHCWCHLREFLNFVVLLVICSTFLYLLSGYQLSRWLFGVTGVQTETSKTVEFTSWSPGDGQVLATNNDKKSENVPLTIAR